MSPFKHRLSAFNTTISAEVSALATATGAINLGQGFPDTDGPKEIREVAVRAIREGLGNQYPPGPGIPELRQSVVHHHFHWYGLTYDPETEVLITAGATEAIAAALMAMVQPGDEVLVLEPYYDSYAACIALAGGTRVPVPLHAGTDGFALDLDELCAAVTRRTKAILLNSPHNPTGTVLSRDELTAIAELACERDLVVLSDEVYEHLVFDDRQHLPLATFPGMRERTLTIGSSGKTFSFTGWKVGWVTERAELVAAVRSVKQFLTYVSSGPFQYAIAEALRLPDTYFKDFRDELANKRDLMVTGLREAGFAVLPPLGTYFITADIRPLAAAGVPQCANGQNFCRSLPERIGVAAIPNSVFYDDDTEGAPFVRFAFCKRQDTLDEAIRRLRNLSR
jgi:N-succinyldiaminopimelate aminotransferase